MKLVGRILAVILFTLFFGFAMKNTHEVTFRFFLNSEWQTPLALLLLAFVVAGAVLGVMAMMPTMLRKRREMNRLRTALQDAQAQSSRHDVAP